MEMGTILNVVFIAFIVWFVLSRFLPTKGVKSITTEGLKTELGKQDKQYIDVRTPAEFKGNHIRGFKNIPLHQLSQKVNSLDQNKEVIVICQSGMRSQRAAKMLKKQGFKSITNVTGGMNTWR
ncbi:rhodanese-like domain-containing protein [Bacillus sp. 165]|uniref:rhodanese-like domain-containing protein n=1 Tax=Bacillus sp. 165 TaxID=1529117 RepID=UPI001ADC74AC|nr:rhodanese-like domain-containing protein [Bacillus sp. 165]MBO9130228.1 rhodanese-like domain-containing protein [Bacillus sp. 165]